MDAKSAEVLELPKILAQLAGHAGFAASIDLAYDLAPTDRLDEAQRRQQETAEAVELLALRPSTTIGGARDVRSEAGRAARGIVLEPGSLLDVRETLNRGAILQRTIERLSHQFPVLAETGSFIEPCTEIADAIGRALNDRGEVLDSASPALGRIRSEMKIAFDRLMGKLNAIVHNPNNAKWLQEELITQRAGRYVIPIQAQYKGRIKGVVHDQSASGATLFIEPLSTVELNNAYRQLQMDEVKEVNRILTDLSDQVGREAEAITRTVQALAQLDLAFAKAKYAGALKAARPELLPFRRMPEAGSRQHPGSSLTLIEARHPLLDQETVVPIDIELDEESYAIVITGPNTGGKTVALKTVGLLALMAQCGLHIPAKEAALSIFTGIYADIGDEQSIEQSLSTFSSHMTNIIHILEVADPQSLVLLDELGAGTDPTEGSALARALLSDLLDRGATTIVTTHHPEIKIYAQENRGLRNASVEFDLETLAPTYRLVMGLPGQSNALAIASRLGLREDIIHEARKLVAADDLKVDALLEEIRTTRNQAQSARADADAIRAETEALKQDLRERLEHIEEERREVLRKSRNKGRRELRKLRKKMRKIRQQMQAAGMPLDEIDAMGARADAMETRLDRPIAPALETPTPDDDGDIPSFRLSETVLVRPLNMVGEITELTEEDAEVQVGAMRVRAGLDDLERQTRLDRKFRKVEKRRDPLPKRGASPGMELDMRGQIIEDALPHLDDYLDSAYMAGLPFVRIIHGKGTGALRRAVREALREHPLVASTKSGDPKEGGDGVTVVKIVQQS